MTSDVWVVLPLACLAGGAFAVYLVARLLTDRNDLLALFTALVFAAALVAMVPLQLTTGVGHLPVWWLQVRFDRLLGVATGIVPVYVESRFKEPSY